VGYQDGIALGSGSIGAELPATIEDDFHLKQRYFPPPAYDNHRNGSAKCIAKPQCEKLEPDPPAMLLSPVIGLHKS